jgi:hypothetical protein
MRIERILADWVGELTPKALLFQARSIAPSKVLEGGPVEWKRAVGSACQHGKFRFSKGLLRRLAGSQSRV